ncbi:MAG: VWA domain-containing protein [Planctomycetota bacterium]
MMRNESSEKRGDPVKRQGRGYGKRAAWVVGGLAALVLAGLFLLPLFFEFYVDGFAIHQASHRAWIRNILWEEPDPLSNRIRVIAESYEPAISADGLTLVFTGGKASANADLYISRKQDQEWGEPIALDALNTEYDELGPELSRDGHYLYFYSNRPGGIGGYDLWVSRWTGEGWNTPENLGQGVNSEFNEYGPGLSPDGNQVYFSSNRLERELTPEERDAWKATLRENFVENDYDIFCAASAVPTGARHDERLPALPRFEDARRVDILNSPADEGQVAMTRRGDFLYFSSNRRGGVGRFDLYRARILYGELTEPENMGEPVNSGFDDMDPALTAEGYGLVFSSNRNPVAGQQGFGLYETFSREVITQNDYASLSAFFRALDKIKWPLLLLLLGLLALLYLLRYLRHQRFGMYASLLHRCLLISLLIHLLLALLTSSWMVGSSLYDLAWEDQGELCLNLDALSEEQIGLDIREQVIDLDSASAPPLEVAPQDFLMVQEIRPQALEEVDFASIEPQADGFALSEPLAMPALSEESPLQSAAYAETLEALRKTEPQLDEPAPKRQETEPVHVLSADQPLASKNNRAYLAEAAKTPVALPSFHEQGPLPDDSALQDRVELHSLPDKAEEVFVKAHSKDPTYYHDDPSVSDRALEVPAGRRDRLEAEQTLRAIQPERFTQERPVALPEEPFSKEKRIVDLPALKTTATPLSSEKSAVEIKHHGIFPAPVQKESLAQIENEKPSLPVPSMVDLQMEAPERREQDKASEITRVIPKDLFQAQANRSQPVDVSNTDALKKLSIKPPLDRTEKQVTRSWADTASPRRRADREPEVALESPVVPARPLPNPWDKDPKPALEQYEKEPQKQVAQDRTPLTRKLPLDFSAERTPMSLSTKDLPAPSPEIALKTDPPLQILSALDNPERADRSDRMPEMKRFEHGSPPTYHGLEMRSRRVVFCLDVSSSMEWNNRIKDARQELLRLLETLDETVEFNIITFSGHVSIWDRRGVRPGLKENVESAKKFVQRARIASDGTNTVDALLAALSDQDVESIFFLSDGHPTMGPTTDNDEILERVRKKQSGRSVIIHTIAYIKGDPPPQWRNRVPPKDRLVDLMTRLAEENHGQCVVIDEK